MSPDPPRPRYGPEAKIQEEIIAYLRAREWVVRATHGNVYQAGFPDLYCAHARYHTRWVEVKYSQSYSFTKAQREFFPLLASCGVGIWILTAATEEEYLKLWQPANWYQFLEAQKVISRPRPSLKGNEGYIPKYPIVERSE